jgi:hypothetical protein
MIIKIKGSNVFSGLGNISSLGQPYNVTVTCATAGATITITASGMTTVTSTSGTATMSNIPYGTVATYTVSASGYTTKTGTVTSTVTIPVTLTATSTGGGTEQPGTGGGSGETPTYIETTIGSTNYATKIVPSWEDVDLTINGIISTAGGSNCTINTTSSGRCSNIDYVLQVNGGETISFAPTSLVGSWALTEFKDIPLIKDNFTPNGDASKSWLTGNATLQTATKYIIINFKKAGSGDFTKENIADIKNTININ